MRSWECWGARRRYGGLVDYEYQGGVERLLLLIGGLSLIHPSVTTDIVGIVCVGGVYLMQNAHETKDAGMTGAVSTRLDAILKEL